MQDQYKFLESARVTAYYGLKRDGKGYAYTVLDALRQAAPQLTIVPVHPSAGKLGGMAARHSARAISPAPNSAIIVLKADDARAALEDAKAGGVRQAWLVLNAASRDNLDYARSMGLPAVGGCPLVFLPGMKFPHNLHRGIAQLFRQA
jgi:predicted CoA-binding protein